MNIEELKKACDILSNVLKCHKTEDCDVACSTCPNDFDENEYDEALDTAIKVIGDVIKQMEKLTDLIFRKDNNGESGEEGSTED